MRKIKVVWLAVFSDPIVRNNVKSKIGPVEKLLRNITKSPANSMELDTCVWVSNGIEEMKAHCDIIELHVITSRSHMVEEVVEFQYQGIYYHIFEDEEDRFFVHIAKHLIPGYQCQYKRNSKWINRIIDDIDPDIIHLIGAENPVVARAIVDCKRATPIIVTLQTLMSEPGFCDEYPISKSLYDFRVDYEQKVFKRCDYIGMGSKKQRDYISQIIKPDAKFFCLRLPMGISQPPIAPNVTKTYDFVYYAGSIEKSIDFAIEEFALAKQKHPNITLDVIGGYSDNLLNQCKARLRELGIEDSVFFEGLLPTHDDVLRQIQYSKYALLPLKVDYISTTLLEGMSLGIPVVTTATKGTPTLNAERESLLISEIGDHKALADNMCKLIEDEAFAKKIADNAYLTVNEMFNNSTNINHWVDIYNAVYNHYKNGESIPDDLYY